MNNPAFEFLRQFKQVSEVTEELVTKTLKRKYPDLTYEQLTNVFEKGISGDYGKVYTIDPQTILGWVSDYMAARENPSNYFEEPLLDNTIHITDVRYPTGIREWNQEVNKCYNAYLRGVNPSEFHPHIYDRLVMDNKLNHSYFLKHLSDADLETYKQGQYERIGDKIRTAKHKSIAQYFEYRKSLGHDRIYMI